MNYIFFLPFILVASIGFYHDTFALETITGYNYFDIDNGDGTRTWKTHEPYVFDGNSWVPFIQTGNTVHTDLASVTLNNDGSFSWNNKFTDSIVAKYADISDLNSWTYPATLNSDIPDISWDGSQFVSSKIKSGIGKLDYKYVLVNGKWKTQLEATNLSGLTTKVFGFDQTIDLQSDTIKFGGITRNLDNFHGVTFDKNFLDANQGKVLDLLNGVGFDFDLGYENLYSVTVYDTGASKSRLVFDYRTDAVLLPNETQIIDPTFTGIETGSQRDYTNSLADPACSPTFNGADNALNILKRESGSAVVGSCQAVWLTFDTSSITGAISVTAASIEYDITGTSNPINCDWLHLDLTPGADQTTMDNLLKTGALYTVVTSNSATCTSTADGLVDTFNSASYPLILADINGDDVVAIGFTYNSWARGASIHQTIIRDADAVLSITYTDKPSPDAVDDLTSPSQSYGTVDLSWTEPGLNGETCQGYQINYTTPYGRPLTVITNNTNSCTTSTSVTGLGTGTPYTFGVSIWTAGGNNATHPPMTWYNITTGGNFTIGTATFNQTNPFVLPITFEEQTINGTAEFLNVTFSNTFNLACDFHYKFANTNQTYDNLVSYPVSSTLNEASFVFTNGTNEIIDVYCWDQITDTNARYLLKQTDFPILDQILGFRSGDYGTEGMFGVFDLVTLLVIIGSMIGLNRDNESVGIVFNVMLMFSLSFFGIIELTTVIFGMIALVLVFVITSTKKS